MAAQQAQEVALPLGELDDLLLGASGADGRRRREPQFTAEELLDLVALGRAQAEAGARRNRAEDLLDPVSEAVEVGRHRRDRPEPRSQRPAERGHVGEDDGVSGGQEDPAQFGQLAQEREEVVLAGLCLLVGILDLMESAGCRG